MFADLHLHTHFSDGTFSPVELVREALRAGLTAIAVTDHDTMEACPATAQACRAEGLGFIPGTELTAEINDQELHLLGYHFRLDHPRLAREMARFQQVRQERIREIVERLHRVNIPLPLEAVLALANCRSPGRPHVGRALVQAGFCSSLDEAFERFLKKHRPAFVPKFKISAAAAIDLIHEAGGLAVLAHPGLIHNDALIPPLVEQGLDGLECYHSKHSPAASERYRQLAAQFQLLVTGGSDCHGMNKGKPLIGTVKLPYEFVRQLTERVGARHSVGEFAPADLPASPS